MEPATSSPLIPDVGVLAVVPDRWENPRQTRHHLLAALARYFHVVWYGPVPEWRQVVKDHKFTLRHTARSRIEGLIEYTPSSLLPRVYRPQFVGDMFERRRLSSARRSAKPAAIRKWVLYLWHPEYVSTLRNARYDISCYHIDDEYSFLPNDPPNDPIEVGIIEKVNQVFIHSNNLMIKKGHLNPNTIRIPNGVDFDRYATPWPEPEDMSAIPHPRLGYVGYIKTHMDLPLHMQLARARQDWHFVFVGPVGAVGGEASLVNALFAMPNVHYLGPKPPLELAAYTQHFDVCMMGYKLDDYTKYIYPLKMHEYLATGLPVVSSPIPAVKEFADVIMTADGLEGWIKTLDIALGAEAHVAALTNRRRDVARAYDWGTLAGKVAEAMCRQLGPEFAAQYSTVSRNIARPPIKNLLIA